MRQSKQELILLAVFTILLGITFAEVFKVLGETKRNVSSIVGAKYSMQQANAKLGKTGAASCNDTPSQNNTKKLLKLKAQLEDALINNNNVTSEVLK